MTTPLPTKDALLVKLRYTRQDVLDAIAGLGEDQVDQPITPDGQSVRAVLAHLLVWDWAKLDMIRQGLAGGTPAAVQMMAALDATNDRAAAEWRDRPLADLLTALHAQHADLLAAVAALTPAQLAGPAPPPRLPTETFLDAIEGTVEHNAEHAAELAAWRQDMKRDA